MRSSACRTELRLIERPDEEWMIDALDRAHATVRFAGCDAQAVSGRQVREVSRQPVVACGQLLHPQFAIQLSQPRAGGHIDGDVLSIQRTREQGDNRSSTLSILVVDGVIDAGQVAGMFYQNMLKAASRADEWHAALAGGANGGQDRRWFAIGATGADDDRRV